MRALFVFVFAATSCGGRVVVDNGGAAAPDCALVCSKVEAACPDKTGSCAAQCAGVDALMAGGGPCVALLDAWFACLDQNPAFPCTLGNTTCQADEQAFTACSP
jgi:hypothetical protein